MKRPIITCPCCKGDGLVVLQDVLWKTLQKLATHKSGATATDIYPAFKRNKINITAVNNRLRSLFDMGYATRHREGKHWVYSVKAVESEVAA